MAKRKGLGRGLDALLGSNAMQPTGADSAGSLRQVPVEFVMRGRYQPRTTMHEEALESLAASIREQGMLQPIVVRPHDGGRFEIIAGERRWRAAQRAGLAEVPVLVREVDDQAALAIALVENIQREDLNSIEEAQALKRLIDEFELSHAAAAAAVGRSRAAVSNLLRLLELNEDVRGLVEAGALEMGHARALLGIAGAEQSRAASEVVARGLSVRETEALVRKKARPPAAGKPAPVRDPDLRRLEREVTEAIGARVELKARRGGRGQLVIHYTSLEELDGILTRVRRS